MKIKKYNPEVDFIRIRDFLVDTYEMYTRPYNWTIERWNFARYFVVPIHSQFNNVDELAIWEDKIYIWENEDGKILGVINTENEEPGEVWIQIHPEYTEIYDEMVTFIENNMMDIVGSLGYVKVYVQSDNVKLISIMETRGYKKLYTCHTSEYIIDKLPKQNLSKGFLIKSVLDEDDYFKRAKAKGRAFGSYAPSNWPSTECFKIMQDAPDYRKDLDLFVVAPNGDYAAFCTVWVDEKNKIGMFEPVGTDPDYRRMGLAREVVLEGIRRLAKLGVQKAFVGSGQEFYQEIGFQKKYETCPWIKYFEI